jgi:ATP-dependent RNA helicase DeaD
MAHATVPHVEAGLAASARETIPTMTFPTTHPALARALAARDYSVPTAVQIAVLDANAAGRDMLVSAQTGSGKTVAFGLAMASTLLGEDERIGQAAEPLALIIAPTRELAMQVQRELSWLYAETGARVVTCVGGMDARAEARALGFGAHIVVGTPGRLRDHLERQRLNLSKLKTIVLDEADEMLDLGFREDLEFILDATPKERQTLLFSATMPREIETLARRYQRDAVRIETLRRDEQHADIEYRAIRVAPFDVENAVVNVLRLHEARATLVFCATREAVKRLHARLVERGFSAVALSGELSQNERTQALHALRDGRARVLVATDVAARGLDLPDLALVIHADLPNDHETLLHRSGRTGRAGKKGLCVMIVAFNRRRKAETLLSAARLKVTWGQAPTAEEIRARDQERFLADPVFTEAASEEELALVRSLQAARSADEIALALVRIQRARLPAPEDLAEDTGPPARSDRKRSTEPWKPRERGQDRFERRPDRAPSAERPAGAEGDTGAERRPPRERHHDGREKVWFRLNIGRERNADPRWLLPLICKAGGVTKSEIGAIKIFDRDTRFEIVAEFADKFADAARSMPQNEGRISRVGAHAPADYAAVTERIDALATPSAAPSPSNDGPPARRFPSKEAPRSERPKTPWRERPRTDERAQSSDTARSERPKTPWRERPRTDDRAKSSDAARSERPKTPWHGRPKTDDRTQSSDAPHHERSKAPWQDRTKSDAGGAATKPHRKGPGKGGFSKGPHSRSARPGGAPGASGPAKPTSKYAHKKKHRAGPPSGKK